MRRSFISLVSVAVALLAAPIGLHAQDDFEAFKKKEAERLRSFISKDDADFADFLKRDWRDFALTLAAKPLVRPKPAVTPVAPAPTPAAAPAPSAARPEPPSPSAPAPAAAPGASPALPGGAIPVAGATPSGGATGRRAPRTVAVQPAGLPSNALVAPFYGAAVPVPRIELKLKPLPAELTREAIAAFWEQASASPTDTVLAALQRQRQQMMLGDFPYAQLVYRTALTLANGDATVARLLTWHFLVKSGYAVRVGFSGSNVQLLLKADETLYGVSFFTTGQGRFYALDLEGGLPPNIGAIRTYDGDYPGAKNAVAFQMAELPRLVETLEPRTLRFAYGDRKYEINVGVNRNLIDLLTNYPQTQLQGYLNAEFESSAMDELVVALRPLVAGRSEVDAVNLILRFVQTAFDYKTDNQQFQHEKWMFPEETLYYPSSDCEDRAILFSYLVRKLVPVEVVGLIYADHVATAVHFKTDVPGDFRMHNNGTRYVVADPTYVNASVGMEMPQYKSASPTIVNARNLSPR